MMTGGAHSHTTRASAANRYTLSGRWVRNSFCVLVPWHGIGMGSLSHPPSPPTPPMHTRVLKRRLMVDSDSGMWIEECGFTLAWPFSLYVFCGLDRVYSVLPVFTVSVYLGQCWTPPRLTHQFCSWFSSTVSIWRCSQRVHLIFILSYCQNGCRQNASSAAIMQSILGLHEIDKMCNDHE